MSGRIYASEFKPGDAVRVGEGEWRPIVRESGQLVFRGVGPVATLPLDSGPVQLLRGGDRGVVSTPWRFAPWAVVDTETTGLGPNDRIVEIACVTMRFGCVVDAWSSLVNPGRSIPGEAVAIHGISNEMVADSPSMGEVYETLLNRICRSHAIVGYNIYGFDEPAMAHHDAPPPSNIGIIDALPLVRDHAYSHDGKPARAWKSESERKDTYDDEGPRGPIQFRRVGRHSLERASRELGVNGPETGMESALHRAAWDAVLTGRVLWELRGWCEAPADMLETQLREALARQNASADAFMAEMRAKDAARRVPLDQRIVAAVGELRSMLEEAQRMQEGFEAWRRGEKFQAEIPCQNPNPARNSEHTEDP